MNTLANFITILSLFCGFASVIFSVEGHFTFASWAIILSVFFDGLDGKIARKNTMPSDFGKELDSLADVVSFGIAPSILGYIFVYRHFHFWAILALLVFLLCGIIRLAKYNITPKERLHSYFYGLPTTAAGGISASFILLYRKYTQLPPPIIFLLLVLMLAFLMVSNIRYLNLDGLKQVLGKSIFIILALSLIASILFPEITIFIVFLTYLIFSPFFARKMA